MKEVWDKERPKGLGKPEKLSPMQKAAAKAMAKKAGRPYPNLVDYEAARTILETALNIVKKSNTNQMSIFDAL